MTAIGAISLISSMLWTGLLLLVGVDWTTALIVCCAFTALLMWFLLLLMGARQRMRGLFPNGIPPTRHGNVVRGRFSARAAHREARNDSSEGPSTTPLA